MTSSDGVILGLVLLAQAVLMVHTSCITPSAIGNGYVVSQPPYSNGSKAVYTCQAGYTMQGKADGLTCVGGEWVGTQPSCLATGSTTDSSAVALWVLAALGGLVALILIVFIVLGCLYFCTKEKSSNLIHVAPADKTDHVYTTRYITDYHGNAKNAGTQMFEWEGASKRKGVATTKASGAGSNLKKGKKPREIGMQTERVTVTPSDVSVQTVLIDPVPAILPVDNRSSSESSGGQPQKQAKQVNQWMPHSKPVRYNNTSTK